MCYLDLRLIINVSGIIVDWEVLKANALEIAASIFAEEFRCSTLIPDGFRFALNIPIDILACDSERVWGLCEELNNMLLPGIGGFVPYLEFYALVLDEKELDDYSDFKISEEENAAFAEIFSNMASPQYILMDAVFTQDIDPFLYLDATQSQPFQTPEAQEVMSLFYEEGIRGLRFVMNKSQLLGTLDGIDIYLNVNTAQLESLEVGCWYRVHMLFGYEIMEACPGFYLNPDVQAHPHYFDYNKVSEGEQNTLLELFSIGSTTQQPQPINAFIHYETEFSEVRVFNVGQALCSGIFTDVDNGSGTISREPVAFFDFGIPHTGSTARPRLAPDKAVIVGLLNALNDREHIPIILSHWHMDHCILAKCVPHLLNHTRWFVPSFGCGRAAQNIRHLIETNGGTVSALGHPFLPVSLDHNINIQYGKIEVTTQTGLAHHPHHHCLYMCIQLYSNNSVLLSGDSTYNAIPQHVRNAGYTHLQASHHGGNYGLTPIGMNPADIPIGKGGMVIYSVGPFATHHHPDHAVMWVHTAAGWTNIHNTRTLGACSIT